MKHLLRCSRYYSTAIMTSPALSPFTRTVVDCVRGLFVSLSPFWYCSYGSS